MNVDFDWPVIGHDRIRDFLQKSLLTGTLSHAYLFSGPKHTGKTFMAKLLAKSVFCENFKKHLAGKIISGEKIPCGRCKSCEQFEKGLYADFFVVERPISEKTGKMKSTIPIAEIRSLQERINKRSFLNSYKVVIIPEAEFLSQESGNSLLKTLEEPSAGTIIILVSSSKELLLPTILSRCQLLQFLPLSKENIYDYLVEGGAGRTLAAEVAGASFGRPTVAMKLFNDKDALREMISATRELLDAFSQDTLKKFKLAEKMAKDSPDHVVASLGNLSGLARDILLMKLGLTDLLAFRSLEKELRDIHVRVSEDSLIKFLENLEKTRRYIKQKVHPRVALENLFLGEL
jgi:DNA polymerase III subunit delta'